MHLSPALQHSLASISNSIEAIRKARNKGDIECVVIEHDWPEYETVWQLIKARGEGKPNKIAELTASLLSAQGDIARLRDGSLKAFDALQEIRRNLADDIPVDMNDLNDLFSILFVMKEALESPSTALQEYRDKVIEEVALDFDVFMEDSTLTREELQQRIRELKYDAST